MSWIFYNNFVSFQYRNHILYLIENFQTLVLVGETGSGKTTQVCALYFCVLCLCQTIKLYKVVNLNFYHCPL